MIVQMKVPSVGESIQEVHLMEWLKKEGEWVEQDEEIVEVESEKATLSLPAPATGRIASILKHDGDTVEIGEVIAEIDDEAKPEETEDESQTKKSRKDSKEVADGSQSFRQAKAAQSPDDSQREDKQSVQIEKKREAKKQTSAARRPDGVREEEVVPMSLIRRRIAERLVESQHQSALLTTFNEIDMSTVVRLRSRVREEFQEQHGIKLGFMSFFVKAAVEALKRHPEINAEIRGHDIAYRNYYDIGIAIGGGKGLVVPVLRDADQLSFAEVESAIADFAQRAQTNELTPDELTGGTFTISNGGIYGSLLSTPIINPPQSGVLGMHTIQDRPVARDSQVVIRPMMYVALTYDHRIVDGREAVGFLRHIKEVIEEPFRILLEV